MNQLDSDVSSITNVEIIEFCQKLDRSDWAKMATKSQTVKDIFAHLVGWQREVVLELRKTWNSKKQPWFGLTSDYDDFNARIRNEFNATKPEDLITEFKRWDLALDQEINEIGENQLRAKPEADWVMDEGEDSHFLNHFLQIKKAVGK
jgi:hypothetical protein